MVDVIDVQGRILTTPSATTGGGIDVCGLRSGCLRRRGAMGLHVFPAGLREAMSPIHRGYRPGRDGILLDLSKTSVVRT